MFQEKDNRQVNLREDLEYQDGGIVSRILLKQPTGSVTAFAFDKGQELSEHTCPYDALIQVLEGKAEVTIGGVPHQLAAAEVIQLPGNVPHAVKAPERFKMVLAMLRV